MGASWEAFGNSWTPLEGLLALFKPLRSFLGATWESLGASWSILERSWEHLEAFWSALATSWSALEASWRRLGRLLGAFWVHPEALQRPF